MNTRELLRLLLAERGWSVNETARRTGGRTKQPQLQRYLANPQLEPRRSTLLPVAELLGVPVEAFYDERIAAIVWAERQGIAARDIPLLSGAAGLAHSKEGSTASIGHLSAIVKPQLVTWERLSTMDDLPKLFALALQDDAMAPEYPSGSEVIFSTTEGPARARDLVYLRDAEGNRYVREYKAKTPTRWLAAPSNDGYQALDSQTDGLEVLAISVGRWGRRG